MRQETTRRKSYQSSGSQPSEIYKPGFPMNILGNVKAFAIVGVGIAVIMVFAALLTGETDLGDAGSLPTNTPTSEATASASPDASATPVSLQFEAAEDVIDPENNTYTATIETTMGSFTIDLFADEAPNTVNSFAFLAQEGYFDNTPIHRVAANFVIQGGDPTGTGTGGPGYSTNDEPNEIRNTRGRISMAKAGGQPSFGSQFFINLKDNPSLDFDASGGDKFYPWAEVIEGMDVVDAIAAVETTGPRNETPVEPLNIVSVTINATPKDGSAAPTATSASTDATATPTP
jgi:peptidylprolyl isomerase